MKRLCLLFSILFSFSVFSQVYPVETTSDRTLVAASIEELNYDAVTIHRPGLRIIDSSGSDYYPFATVATFCKFNERKPTADYCGSRIDNFLTEKFESMGNGICRMFGYGRLIHIVAGDYDSTEGQTYVFTTELMNLEGPKVKERNNRRSKKYNYLTKVESVVCHR